MQETAKMNYVQYGKSTKHKKGKKSTQSGASGGNHKGDRSHGTSSKPSGKGKKLPFPQDTCYRCGKNRHQKTQDCKQDRQMFHQLFGKAKDMLQPTPIRMENYGNTAVKVLRMFHVFLRWKDKVYKQLFYVTDCDRSPNLLSRDACYTLGVLKPCYTVENSTKLDTKCEHSFLHQKMSGTEKKLSNNSTKHSISKEQLQGSPLTK